MISADLALLNGNVLTLDGGLPHAQALACRGGKIIYVGDNAGARELTGPGTRTIDLQGKTALPGFNDSHLHLSMFGFELQRVDLCYPKARSVADVKRLVSERAERTPPGEWVRANGYDQEKIAERRHPTRQELDEVSSVHPIVLGHVTGHAYAANGLALRRAGITRDTAPPPGGVIEKDPDTGEPTGLIAEQAMAILEAAMPASTVEDQARAVELACRAFVSAGMTSCTDAGPSMAADSHLAGFFLARERGKLPVRCCVTITDLLLDEANRLGIMPGFGDDRLRVGAMKIFTDGSLIVKTAALCEPYEGDPDRLGDDFKPPEEITRAVVKANAAGWQVAIHAVGDRAIGNALNAIEAALTRNPRKDARHRIEHATTMRPELVDRFVKLGVVPVVQPAFAHYFGDTYQQHLGPRRAAHALPFRTLLDRGLQVAGSSDCSVTPFSPLVGIKCAVVRNTLSERPFWPEHAVTLDEALAMYTWRGAYATFEEKVKGTLSAGKLADIVVVGDDPRKVPPEELDRIPVQMTIMGGEVVYKAPLAKSQG
ncbi:MAG: amidohydrolase [Chloroflexi bacterium]|nr:amidohydrolase [Chloroflexota bacterium]